LQQKLEKYAFSTYLLNIVSAGWADITAGQRLPVCVWLHVNHGCNVSLPLHV